MKFKLKRLFDLVAGSTRSSRWLRGAAGFFLIVAFLGGALLYQVVEGWIAASVEQKLNGIRRKYSLAVEWQAIEVTVYKVAVIGVVVGSGQDVVIDRVDIFPDVYPWSKTFLKPSRIRVGKLLSKQKVPQSERLRWFRELASNLKFSNSQATDSGPSSNSLPKELSLDIGTLILSDGFIEHTRFDDIALRVSPHLRHVKWQIGRIKWAPYLDGAALMGSLSWQSVKEQIFDLKIQEVELATKQLRWRSLCKVQGLLPLGKVECEIAAKELPPLILTHLQPRFGSSFNPSVKGQLILQQASSGYETSFRGTIGSMVVEHQGLSVGAVGPFGADVTFHAKVNNDLTTIFSDDIKIALQGQNNEDASVVANLAMALTRTKSPGGKRLLIGTISIDIPPTGCSDLLGALPKGLAPDIQGFRLRGSASVGMTLHLESDRAAMKWERSKIECIVTSSPEMYTASYLNAPFMLERSLSRDKTVYIPVDPKSRDYVDLRSIPAEIISVFVTSEDAGFWQHHGIEPAAIAQAMERNAKEGRVAVGGSTITMQTVKNLFLSRDKTLARKAQEIFLAWHLEQIIEKKRILEIYLNIAEFGPDLYGIGAASRRFFGVGPGNLSLKQASYLASLLPAPVPRYQNFCRGQISDNYEELVKGILQRMLSLNRISHVDYDKAAAERLQFQPSVDDPTCQPRMSTAESE